MKITILIFVTSIFAGHVFGQDTPYRTELQRRRDRLDALDAELNDYRKFKPVLPASKEEERERLIGQLVLDDPLGTLRQQTDADLKALLDLRERTAADDKLLQALKDFLALISGVMDAPDTREQAQAYADTLRRFILTRDVEAAMIWSRQLDHQRSAAR